MSHISYSEFKNRFGDLGATKYCKAMWLEEGCEEIGKVKGSDFAYLDNTGTSPSYKRYRLSYTLNDIDNGGIRLTKGIYCYSLNTVSDGRPFNDIQPFDIFTISSDVLDVILPLNWTDAQCQAYLKDKVILYKKAYVEFATPKVMEYESGFLLPNNTISPSVTWCHTDYINCEKYSKISLASTSTGIGDGAYDIFYDANKNVITAINHGEGFANEYQIPSNAVYMRLSIVINYEARHYSHKAYFK